MGKLRHIVIPPVLGAMAACGFAPLGLWPLALIGIAGLLALISGATTWRSALWLGWLWGLGHFTLSNNWIATSFTYQAEMPAWFGWLGVVLLACYLALYPALAALGAWFCARRGKTNGYRPVQSAALVPALAGCWIISEWLRSWVFTGYVWNPLAMVTLGPFHSPGLAMIAPWLGTYALSGVVILLAGCWWLQWHGQKRDRWAVVRVLGPIMAFVLPMIWPPSTIEGTLPYTLVQPNMPQQDLTDPEKFEQHFRKTAKLSLPQHSGQQRIVLWPESGVQDYLRDGYPELLYFERTFAADPQVARMRLGRLIGPRSMLLTGAVDLELRQGAIAGEYNVVSVITDQGQIAASYAKAHLVPYGEYLPMRNVLGPLGLTRLVAGSIEFWPGPGPRTLNLGPWGKAGVQICYEIIFSGQVVDRAHRPDYIFNPTNDGWFGWFGPPQHLAQARMRAIEEGLPVLRATTNGISAVIDANGVVRHSIAKDVAGRLDGMVPPAHAATLFARIGNGLPLAWATIMLVISMLALRRHRA